MQRSKSFTNIAFEQKRKGVARKSSPQRQSRPKPEWNDYLTDPNRFKVSEDDLLKKKRLLVSKNNILAPEYQPPSVRSAMATPRKCESSQSTPRKTPREEHRRTHEASSPAVQRQDRVSSLDLLRESRSLADDASSDESHHNDFDSDRDDEDAASAFERRSAQVEEASMAHLDSDDDDDESVRKSSTMKMAAKRTRTPTARDHNHHHHHHSHRGESGASAAASPSPRPTTWGSASRALSSASPVNKRVGKPHSNTTPPSHSNSSLPPPPPVTTAAPHHTAKFVERSDRIGDDDLLDIARNIDHLQQELRMYEEIAGKKSILDAEELQLILGTDEHGTLNVDALNQKTVIRYLVSLVCQTMTYTLQSEVKQQHLESEVALMQSKMDDVLRLLHQQQQQQTAASYSRFVLSAPPMLASLPAPPAPPTATSTAYDHAMAAHQTDEARYEERWSTPIASSAWTSPDTAVAPSPPAAAAATTPHAPTTPFYGTSTSDWLFMRNSPAVASAAPQQQPSPAKAASMPYAATPAQPAKAAASSASPAAAEAFQTPTYEYNLSPETAADLASRTYDMYVAQQQQQQKRTMPSSSSSSSSRASDSGLGELDHYDEMIDRLSYQFSSTKAAKYHPPPPPPSSTGTAASTFPAEGVSIVVPHATAPTPSKPSPHPFQVTYTRSGGSSSGGGNALFPASPPTAKKIYDASLGNYSLVDDTYDDA